MNPPPLGGAEVPALGRADLRLALGRLVGRACEHVAHRRKPESERGDAV